MDEARKILCVASEPSAGMVPFASMFINGKVRSGIEVFAVTVSNGDNDYTHLIDPQVHLYNSCYPTSLPGKAAVKFLPVKLYCLVRSIAIQNGIKDIFLLTGEYGFGLGYGRRLNRRFNLHFVVHDFEPHPDKGEPFKNRLFNRFFNRMTVKNIRAAANLLTCSKAQAEKLRDAFPRKNVEYFPFPSLVTDAMKNGDKECPELNGTDRYILFFGRVSAYKGIDLLYDAFLDGNIDAKLVIAGYGTPYFSRRDDEHDVIWINRFIKDEEVGRLFSRAGVVVYPYTQATMSGVLSIAHYFNTQVIVSDMPFFIDNIADGDIVFKSGDKEALTSILTDIYKRD